MIILGICLFFLGAFGWGANSSSEAFFLIFMVGVFLFVVGVIKWKHLEKTHIKNNNFTDSEGDNFFKAAIANSNSTANTQTIKTPEYKWHSTASILFESPETDEQPDACLSVEIDPDQRWKSLSWYYSLFEDLISGSDAFWDPIYGGGLHETTLTIPLKKILSESVYQDLIKKLERVSQEANKAKGWQIDDSYVANEPVVWVHSSEHTDDTNWITTFTYWAGIGQKYNWSEQYAEDLGYYCIKDVTPFSSVESGWKTFKPRDSQNFSVKCKFIDEVNYKDREEYALYQTEVFPKRIKSLIDVSYLQPLADKTIKKLIKNGLACREAGDVESYEEYIERMLRFL